MSTAVQTDVPNPVETPVGVGATHTSTTEAAHGTEEGGGLPQFEFQHWGGQIIYLLFLFVVLYLLIAKVFAPKMRRVLDERADSISGAIEAARLVQAEAAGQAEAARSASRATAAAAKARVTEEANRRAAEEEAVVSARIAEAESAIGKTRDAAMKNVSTIAADSVVAMVERLTGDKVTAAQAATAVKGV